MIFKTTFLLSFLALMMPSVMVADFVPPTMNLSRFEKAANSQTNGAPEKAANIGEIQSGLLPDVGFYQVPFGAVGTNSPIKFVFTNRVVQILTLVDCFWSTDSFELYDWASPIGNKSAGCSTVDPACKVFRNDPYGCWNLPDLFCTITAIILPGTHSITIANTASPFQGGSFFLRLDTGCSDVSGVVPCCTLGVNGRVCNMSIYHDGNY